MLISAAELAAQPDSIVVDCRFNLLDPGAGRKAWLAGHIPGAFYADLDRDLARPRGEALVGDDGRHPLPDRGAFAALLGNWGLTPDKLLVAYDDVGGAVAARLWWLLRQAGHKRVALLDGGLQAWEQAGLALETGPVTLQGKSYSLPADAFGSVGVDEVQRGLEQRSLTLIDARDAGRFAGAAEPIDPRAGHVPGALNRPFSENLSGGRFKSPARLRQEFDALFANRPDDIVSMCGSGVTACHNLFAMELAGLRPGRLYVGSWSGWLADPQRPVAQGDGNT